MKINEVENKNIMQTGEGWKEILYKCPYKIAKQFQIKVDELEGEELYAGYIYVHDGFHQRTGERVQELRGVVKEILHVPQNLDIKW